MKDNLAFLDALQQIAKDKGISVDISSTLWPTRSWPRTSGCPARPKKP